MDDLCRDWLALYEVWKLGGPPVRVLTINVELALDDMKLLAKDVPPSDIFSLQIPYGLCTGRPLFFVLQTVFVVDYNENMSHAKLRSHSTEPRYHEHAQVTRNSLPAPQVRFSALGNFLLVSRCYDVGDEVALDLTLFVIDTSPDMIVKCLIETRLQCPPQSDPDLACAGDTTHSSHLTRFHPTLPLVIITFGSGVYSWDFTQGNITSSSLLMISLALFSAHSNIALQK